ncbi:MAG: LexA family transcriptional regulator [Eubacteriaceae bacterium]|nr:LexA family transcriptional regulator [Eubacteriaceae bacterium]
MGSKKQEDGTQNQLAINDKPSRLKKHMLGNYQPKELSQSFGNKQKSMDLGKKLADVRQTAKLSRSELASLLGSHGFEVKTYTIGKWETGVSKPTVEAFLAICDICSVPDIRQAFSGKRLLRLYEMPVSAGFGNYLDNGSYQMIEIDNTVPKGADYALKVAGDSMAPRFVNGQIIFVKENLELDKGEIGIFGLNNEAYLKKLGDGCLVSLNASYNPIPILPSDDFVVFGKVVG